MYLEEIYRQEQCVRNCVILHREGMFWKAYEKSAYLFCTHIKPFKATKKRIKYMGGQEMISIGIEDGTEDAYFARFTLAETTPTTRTYTGFPSVNMADFNLWKNHTPVKAAVRPPVTPEPEVPAPEEPKQEAASFPLPEERRKPGKIPVPYYQLPVFRTVRQFRDKLMTNKTVESIPKHFKKDIVDPMLEPTFIYDSYSCQKGKGTQLGRERFAHHIRSCTENFRYTAFVLEGDISGYFMSIVREQLLEIVLGRFHKRLDDRDIFGQKFRDVLDVDLIEYLIRLIILRDPLRDCVIIGTEADFDSIPPQKLLKNAPPGVGIAIGDITSQLFSNIYMDELDRFVKRVLKVKHYCRYVDDWRVASRDRQYLECVRREIEAFMNDYLCLTLHPHKTRIVSTEMGIPFLGAMVLPHRTYVSERTVKRFHVKMNRIERVCMQEEVPYIDELLHMRDVINSYLGHLMHFKSHNILQEQFTGSPILKYFSFDDSYRKCTLTLPAHLWHYRESA